MDESDVSPFVLNHVSPRGPADFEGEMDTPEMRAAFLQVVGTPFDEWIAQRNVWYPICCIWAQVRFWFDPESAEIRYMPPLNLRSIEIHVTAPNDHG